MLSGAVLGGIFVSPSVSFVLAAIHAVISAALHVLVKNYTDYYLNFGLACEIANAELRPIPTRPKPPTLPKPPTRPKPPTHPTRPKPPTHPTHPAHLHLKTHVIIGWLITSSTCSIKTFNC